MSRIITFYSYKGGTGRSMALANVAWALASHNNRVLLVDWDLEAPGLHRYFRPFLVDRELTAPESSGLIDLVCSFRDRPAPSAGPGSTDQDWHKAYTDVARWAIPLRTPDGPPLVLGETGEIRLLSAGRQDADYGSRVNAFAWDRFYAEQDGGAFFNAVRESMRAFDYVLIDSRTGVSDTAGITTIQMPDVLVVCYTYNIQSIEGASRVAHKVRSQRPDLPIFPVAMRAEYQQEAWLERMRKFAQLRFRDLVDHSQPRSYYTDTEVPYWSQYAYWERLAAFDNQPEAKESINREMARLASLVSDRRIGIVPASDELKRQVPQDPTVMLGLEEVSEPAPNPLGRRLPVRVATLLGAAAALIVAIATGVTLAQVPLPSAQRAQLLARVVRDLPAIKQLGVFLEGTLAETPETRALYKSLYQRGIPIFTAPAQRILFAPSGQTMVTCSPGVTVWTLDGRRVQSVTLAKDDVAFCDLLPSGDRGLVLTFDGISAEPATMHSFDIGAAASPATPSRWSVPADAVGFVAGRGRLLDVLTFSSTSSTLHIVRLEGDGQVSRLADDTIPSFEWADFAATSNDFVFAALIKERVRVWRYPYGPQARYRSVEDSVVPPGTRNLRISPSGRRLVAFGGPQVEVFDLDTNKSIATLAVPDPGSLVAVVLDPTDRFMGIRRNSGIVEVRAIERLDKTAWLVKTPEIDNNLFGYLVDLSADAKRIGVYEGNQVVVYRRDEAPPSPDASWSEILRGLRTYTSICMDAETRRDVFTESTEVAAAAFDNCERTQGRPPIAATPAAPTSSPQSSPPPASPPPAPPSRSVQRPTGQS